MPGCYIILIYRGGRIPRNLSKYNAGYVGQSVDVESRLRDHLAGSGNSNVYADIRSGMAAAVQIIPCSAESLNDVECALIYAFGRDKLYNMTDGGSMRRCESGSEFIFADRRLYPRHGSDRGEMRRAVFRAAGRKPVSIYADGIRLGTACSGLPISTDLAYGRHSFKARCAGRLAGKKTVSMSDGMIFTAAAKLLRVSLSAIRLPHADEDTPPKRGGRLIGDPEGPSEDERPLLPPGRGPSIRPPGPPIKSYRNCRQNQGCPRFVRNKIAFILGRFGFYNPTHFRVIQSSKSMTERLITSVGIHRNMRCAYCGCEISSLCPFSMCPSCGQPFMKPEFE